MNQIIDRDDTTTLICTSLGGPQNMYQWQFNESNILGEVTEQLTVSNITASVGGLYTCVVTNDAGNDTDSTYLFVSPYFITPPADLQRFNGSSASFLCDAEAFPYPEYQWARVDGAEIRGDVMTTERELIFDGVLFGDEGGYYCNVSSGGIVATSLTATLASKNIFYGGYQISYYQGELERGCDHIITKVPEREGG